MVESVENMQFISFHIFLLEIQKHLQENFDSQVFNGRAFKNHLKSEPEVAVSGKKTHF